MRMPFKRSSRDDNTAPPAPTASELEYLESKRVPLRFLPDCAACEDPCDGDDAYAKLDIDRHDTPMVTSMKPYGRIAISSTGKSDWPREVTEVDGTLATLLDEAYRANEKAAGQSKAGKGVEGMPSVYSSSLCDRLQGVAPHRKVTLLNGSHQSPDSDSSSVLIFPDYKIVQDIPITSAGAAALVGSSLSPEIQPFARSADKSLRSWPLAYRAVILICSHKRRDKKCHVVAPYMISEFTRALEAEGLSVDERGDEAEHGPEPPIEEWTEEGDERQSRYERARRRAAASDTVGIFKVSHIGGHRYAGNAIICLPSGVNVWYGRVAPSDCQTIVKETILGGKVIAEFLRGGIGIEGKTGPKGILEW